MAATALASAQQQVRIVVPFGAGGPPDMIARMLSDSLRVIDGNTYVVDNRAGAAGVIGTADVAKAKPDGSVLLITTGGHATNAALHKNLPYDSIKSFTPIAKLTVNTGFALLVPTSSPYMTVEQLVAAAKARPGTLSYASSGIGNSTHIAGALFAKSANLNLIHIPYRAGPMTDLIGGHVDLLFWGSSASIPLIKGGKVRALAIAGDHRVAELPDVPTLKERGIAGVDVPAWVALFGPGGMTPELAQKIARNAGDAMKRPAFVEALKTQPDSRIVGSSPAEFRADLEKEIARLKRDLGPLNIEME